MGRRKKDPLKVKIPKIPKIKLPRIMKKNRWWQRTRQKRGFWFPKNL